MLSRRAGAMSSPSNQHAAGKSVLYHLSFYEGKIECQKHIFVVLSGTKTKPVRPLAHNLALAAYVRDAERIQDRGRSPGALIGRR